MTVYVVAERHSVVGLALPECLALIARLQFACNYCTCAWGAQHVYGAEQQLL